MKYYITILTAVVGLQAGPAMALCGLNYVYDTYTGTCVPSSSYGENSGSGFYGTTQDNSSGQIYDSNQPKPQPEYGSGQSSGVCTYDSPCCPRVIDGVLNWS